MKMSPFLFSIAIAATVTVLLLLTKNKDNQETNTNYGGKVFFITLIVSYMLFTFFIGGSAASQEIDVGEPPF
jgi:hypothetical protein